MGNNFNAPILESISRTATTTGDSTNSQHSGCHIIIDMTVLTAGASIVPTIQAIDTVSGKYYTLLVGAAIVAVGTVVMKIFPSATAVVNLATNDMLPSKFRVLMTHADAKAVTYSVGVSLV